MQPSSYSLSEYHRDTYCSQTQSLRSSSIESVQDVMQVVDRILSKICLCRHDIEEISFYYRQIEHLEKGMEIRPEQGISSLMIIERVQNRIGRILSSRDCSTENFINLYHLARFFPLESPNISLKEMLVTKRRNENRRGDLSCISIAKRLPYCISEKKFKKDLKILIGPGQNDLLVKKVVDCKVKILFNAKLRKERKIFFETEGLNTYAASLDEILEGGFLYLYEHLLNMKKCQNPAECDEESKKINASTFSHILLEVKQAIFTRVVQEIPLSCANVIFLIGNTGSGKSTTLAFLSGDPLERKGNHYELANQENLIGHGLTHSQTFLPNVRIIQGVAYVDFPGFNDTRGFLIDWGVELALKALIARYHPKIMVVESIMALRGSRGGHVTKLGQDLQRLLGLKSANCQLALTQYLQMRELGELEGAQAQKSRLEEEIQQLEEEIQEKETSILQIQERIQDGDLQKIEKLEKKIQKLIEDINDLEMKETPLTKLEERFLASSRKELKKRKEKLAELQVPASSESNIGNGSARALLGKQIQIEREEIQSKTKLIQTKSKEKNQQNLIIEEAEKAIKKEEDALISMLGIKDAENEIIRLDYLDQISTLDACRQSLIQARKVSQFRREIRLEYRTHLIQLLTDEFAFKTLPPPKESIDIRDLQNRILETSLINVLTEESFPEIGQFLHLSEMDPGCIKSMDKELVEQFTDQLIRLIVTAPISISDQKEPVAPIEQLIRNFNAIMPAESRESLPSDWSSLQKAILFSSRQGATTWEELQENYRFDIEKRLKKIQETKDNHLKEWDDWARRVLRIPVKLPEFIYRAHAQSSANRLATEQAIALHDELCSTVKKLNESLRQIKDLEKIIVYRDRIDQIWEFCQFSSLDPDQFIIRIEKGIVEVSQIYNQRTGNEEVGPWEDRLSVMEMKLGQSIKELSNRVQLDGFLIELMMLELIERDQCTGETFVEAALRLAKAVDKQKKPGAIISLAAANAARQIEAAEKWIKLLAMTKQYGLSITKAIEAVDGLREVIVTTGSIGSVEELNMERLRIIIERQEEIKAIGKVGEVEIAQLITIVDIEKLLKFVNTAIQAADAIVIKYTENEVTEAIKTWKALLIALENLKISETEENKQKVIRALLQAFFTTKIAGEAESNIQTQLRFDMMSLFERTLTIQKLLVLKASFTKSMLGLVEEKLDTFGVLIMRAMEREAMVRDWIFETNLATINERFIYKNIPSTENLVLAMGEINNGLAQRLELDLGITLHRLLLLALLAKHRSVSNPFSMNLADVPMKDNSLAGGFEREL